MTAGETYQSCLKEDVYKRQQKDMGRDDFTKIPGGLPGVETRGEVVYLSLIHI